MSNFVPEKTALGIEFGSTRIKAVLIGPEHTPLAQGDYTWEPQSSSPTFFSRISGQWATYRCASCICGFCP